MRLLKALALALLLVAVTGAVWYGITYYRHRFVRSNGDLAKLLPPGDLTVFFADLNAVRHAGLLRLLAGLKPAPEEQYAQFMQKTQFDFARDLDALAGAYDGDRLYLVGRGHFDWDKLQAYSVAHGGTCGSDFCQEPGSTAGKWANFVRVQPDVIALAVSSDRTAADVLRPPGRRLQGDDPGAPVWVKLSRALRRNPSELPLPLQIFAISVQSADEITLAVQPVKEGAFEIRLFGDFANPAAADTARAQLDIQTRNLRRALGDEGQKSDLGAVLLGGKFYTVGTRLEGSWPVDKELVAALE